MHHIFSLDLRDTSCT